MTNKIRKLEYKGNKLIGGSHSSAELIDLIYKHFGLNSMLEFTITNIVEKQEDKKWLN